MLWSILVVILISLAPYHFSQKTYNDIRDIQASQVYFGANTVRTFTGKLLKSNRKHSFLVTFSPKFDAINEVIKGLELSLYWQPNILRSSSRRSHIKFTISDLKNPDRDLSQVTKIINHQHTGIYNFQVKTSMGGNKNKSFLVNIDLIDLEKGQVIKDFSDDLDGKVTQATLIVYSKDQDQGQRTKREAKRNDDRGRRRKNQRKRRLKNEQKNACHLEPYTVSFEDLGWDSIISPANISMNLCIGHCSFNQLPAHLEPSNHAVMQNHYNKIIPIIPPPCCIGIEYEPISMLVINADQEVELKPFDKMIIKRCGCR